MRGRRACCVALVAVVAHALDEHLFYDLTDGRATFKVAAGYKHILGWIAVKRSERLVSAWVHAAMAATPAGEAGTMLDIGANAGYFGLMSIALGGRAVFFDPAARLLGRHRLGPAGEPIRGPRVDRASSARVVGGAEAVRRDGDHVQGDVSTRDRQGRA